ncbi:MAG TPA: hypothetical protein G4O03_01065 [Dehalococcoidia bacterium]|nr:hypothetical protein [Dehalococcoidia bacterium]
MWVEVKRAPNLMMAEMWRELFEAEGIPTRLLPATGDVTDMGDELVAYQVLVPSDKAHLIEEILRKV